MNLCSLLLRRISPSKHSWTHRRHSSMAVELASSDEVLTIIETINPMEPALEPLVPFLSPNTVASVLKNPPNPQLGFRFFIWASNYKRFHSWKFRRAVLHNLFKENGLDLCWETLNEVRRLKLSIPANAFTLLIEAYKKLGLPGKAVEAFGLMEEYCCKPDVFIYNKVLHIMIREGLYLLSSAIYNKMLKSNCLPDYLTFAILIDGFCKSNRTQHALQMFDEMAQRKIRPNKIIYTAVISGLCEAKKVDDAYTLFKKMKSRRCTPDSATCNTLLNGFCKVGRIDEAFALLKSFDKDGYVLGGRGFSCLIDGLFEAGRYEEAKALYRKMIKEDINPDVVSYTIMMKGLTKAGKVDEALQLLNEMNQRGVVPDTYCYNYLIKGFCDMGLLEKAQSLQLEISKNNCFPDNCTYTILICGMCRNGMVGEAQQLFIEMENLGCYPSVVTYNALMDGLCKTGETKKAHHLLYQMEIGRKPSLFLRLCQGRNRVLDSASLQTMVQKLCDRGLIFKAYTILKQLAGSGVMPDIQTYNILINGFCRMHNIEVALLLFKELQLKGISPDAVTYGTLINGLQSVGREEDAFRVFDEMLKNGCKPGKAVYNALMTWSCRRKKLSLAFRLCLKYLRGTIGQEVEAINLIEELFEKGDIEKAIRALLELQIKLSEFWLSPYTIFLIGLCQAGRIEEASKIFFILEEHKVIVPPPSCVRLMSGLCRQGNLDLTLYVFRYTIEKGYILKSRNCNWILRSLLDSKYKINDVLDVLDRMKSLGYNLDACLHPRTKILLHDHWKEREMENVPPGC